MSTLHLASAFADPPVYAAGRGSRIYAVPGAATRGLEPESGRPGRFVIPALCFAGGLAAGASVALAFSRMLLK